MLFIFLCLRFFFPVDSVPAKPALMPTFEGVTIDSSISIGYGVSLGDVDGDGRPDILLADKKQFAWYRNGDWKKFVIAENLTEFDNVCITAQDVNNDGKVEVAVGAQWNPSETADAAKSGAVFYLVRPEDPTKMWKPIRLHHEPTIHRMRWAKSSNGKYYLIVVPLHGQGNKDGQGAGVNILAYEFPKDVNGPWKMLTLDRNMHLTHNVDVVTLQGRAGTDIYIAGKEGVRLVKDLLPGASGSAVKISGMESGAGEVRFGRLTPGKNFVATIEPMHGEQVAVYLQGNAATRVLLDSNYKEGHALAVADFTGTGEDQVVAGWRVPNNDGKTGIKLFRRKDGSDSVWESSWIDENGIACEDIQVMDLNADGKTDIVASGRATKNLKIYWNRSGQ